MRYNLEVETFPECLTRLREARGVSQKSLALAARMDQSYVAGLETGRRPPPRDKQLLRLATALNGDESVIAELLNARAVTKIANIGAHIGPPKMSALTHLIVIAAGMTPIELNILDQLAQSMRALRCHNRCKEASMVP